MLPEDGTCISIITYSNLTALDWFRQDCAPPPPSCGLEITGVTSTNETILDAGDGTISISVSGNTGGTVTYTITKGLEQRTYAANTASHTFTGVTTGQWTIHVSEGACYDDWASEINILQGYFETSALSYSLPASIVASENPVVFELMTQPTGVSPANGIYTFTVANTIPTDFHIEFDLETPLYNTTIWAKGFPNRSNYMLTSILTDAQGNQLTNNSYSDIAQSLAEAINSDLVLSKLYYVSVSNAVVTLKTKEQTGKYNLINNGNLYIYNQNNVITTTGVTFSTTTQGADQYQGSLTAGYGTWCTVFVSTSEEFGGTQNLNNFIPVAELELPYLQSSNVMRYNLSDVLKPYCSTPKIDLTFTGYTTLLPCIRPYYINYGESFFLVKNSASKRKRQKGTTSGNIMYFMNASLPYEDVNDMSTYIGNYDLTGGTNQTVTGVTFLTLAPNPTYVQRNNSSYLYFVLPKDYGKPLELRGDIAFYDGSNVPDYKFFDITTTVSGITSNFGGVIALCISSDKLDINGIEYSGNTFRKVKQIDFAIHQLSGTSLYSEVRSLHYAIDEAERKFGVMFLNSLGGYDAFDFSGIVEDTVERNVGTYTVPREYNSGGASPLGFAVQKSYNVQTTKMITVNSGWINSDMFDWLIELLKSPSIYSYTEANQNYLNLVSFTYKKSSLEDLFDMEVTFKLTTYENNISV
jgi:hypothetical protein